MSKIINILQLHRYLFVQLVVLLLVSMMPATELRAWDTEPDADGLYDGFYDRPTYFPNWEHPVILQLSDATGIDWVTENGEWPVKSIRLYDNGGRLVSVTERPDRLYTEKDLRGVSNGIYYQQIIYQNGQSRIVKMVK
ncbi:MAG: T9SS type A sorting domain-containing protein [Prevotella sp.]|nr:T9SS type A sorting domain-containing protein [Prevotella sp.]